MKLKEIEQVEIFPPTTYFFISTIVERFLPPKRIPLLCVQLILDYLLFCNKSCQCEIYCYLYLWQITPFLNKYMMRT